MTRAVRTLLAREAKARGVAVAVMLEEAEGRRVRHVRAMGLDRIDPREIG